MSCYCNGKLSDNQHCPSTPLPLSQNLNCTLNCDCEWINLSEWSPCKGGSQYQTRECSCEDKESSEYEEYRSYQYSSLCNGFTQITRFCESENTTQRVLSVDSWKTATWPNEDETKSRNFSSCSNETWFQLINTSSPNSWESLAAEVIATHLNILTGAASEEEIAQHLDQAEKLLLSCNWTDSQTTEAEELLESLSEFNIDRDSSALLETGSSSANEKSANQNQTNNSLLLWILVPTVIVVVVATIVIVVALIVIKKKKTPTNEVINA